MKINKLALWSTAGISLFLGLAVGMALIGAVIPSVHKLTGGLVCSGTVEIKETKFNNGPRSSYSDLDVICSADGRTEEITTSSFVILGLISTILFSIPVGYFMRWLFSNTGNTQSSQKLKSVEKESKNGQSGMERMSELKKMRDENLITQAEFERKKSEIMEEL